MTQFELDLKEHDLLESFVAYQIYTKRIKEGEMVIDRIEGDIDELKQQYDEINEKGKIVNSYVLPRPVDEMKEEMRRDIGNLRTTCATHELDGGLLAWQYESACLPGHTIAWLYNTASTSIEYVDNFSSGPKSTSLYNSDNPGYTEGARNIHCTYMLLPKTLKRRR